MLSKRFIKRTFIVILLINLIEISKSSIEIVLTFNDFNALSDNHLYCDDEIKYFGTSNLNVYEINESNEKININSKLQLLTNFYNCKNIIFFKNNSINHKILIEMLNYPANISKFFEDSTAISIDIKKGFFNNYTDFSYMFYNCTKLSSVDLSNFSFNEAKYLNSLFSNCVNLKSVVFPNQTNYLNGRINCSSMFSECLSLTSIDLTSLYFTGEFILNNMFFNCSKIESIKLNGNLYHGEPYPINDANSSPWVSIKVRYPVGVKDIFKNCFSLKNIDLFFLNISYDNTDDLFNLTNLDGCLFNKYDSKIKKCSKYMGFHHCGSCKNENTELFCEKEIQGKNYTFYYLSEELDLTYNERKCFWSDNYNDFNEYKFIRNPENEVSYYQLFCKDICEICSKDNLGCIKCKNNLYPIDTEYNDFVNNKTDSFICYEKEKFNNYFLELGSLQLKKCNKNFNEYPAGTNICSLCNYSEGYYKIENQEYNCESPLCNDRCKKCDFQSQSELDHQCTLCKDNYYSFKTDYFNYLTKRTTGFNCYSLSEVKEKNINYYLNSEGLFEKCDISCYECENSNNKCKKCNVNYYEIFEHKNGTCFKNPLEKYGLAESDGKIYFKKCYHLCKYCIQITDSFLFQQCTECDEIDYTLDLFSYQKSLCIPKDKSNFFFIQNQTKWYIDNFKGIESLTLINKKTSIDYELLLNDIKYSKITYTILNSAENCPPDKPYIIYSIRQCVSSCNSSNLLEHGLFMTKKLYAYNNICYDECPYGSLKDDKENICKESNQHVIVNNNITKESFLENYQINIIIYLTQYANNTVGITRINDFSNYFYGQTLNNSLKLELEMPIFDFTECIKRLKNYYRLGDETNVFIGIKEYDTQKDEKGQYNLYSSPINLTTYQFFINNGTILNHSICSDIQINVEKKVDTLKIDYNLLKELEEKYNIKLYENGTELNDYCTPLIIDNRDLTLYERQMLVKKNIKPCDDNCIYQSFNYLTNYSSCVCPIILNDYDEMAKEKIMEKIRDNVEEIDNLLKLMENGNLKYFKCLLRSFKYYNRKKHNFLIYFSLASLIIGIIFMIKYFIYDHKKILDEYAKIETQKKKEKEQNEIEEIHSNNENITISNNDNINRETNLSESTNSSSSNRDNIDDRDDPDYSQMDYNYAIEKDNRGFCEIHISYFRKKSFFDIEVESRKYPSFLSNIISIIICISFHTYFFISAVLYSDYYVSKRYLYKGEIARLGLIAYIFINELDRIFLTLSLSFVVIKIIRWILYEKSIEYLDKLKTEDFTLERVIFIKKFYNGKCYVFHAILLLSHCLYSYFILIFGNINSNSQLDLIFSLIISVFFYFVFCHLYAFLITILRVISLECKCDILYKFSVYLVYIQNLLKIDLNLNFL